MDTQIRNRKPGRPPGSKNRQTLLATAITEGLEKTLLAEMPAVIEAAISAAKEGDVPAMGLLMKTFLVSAESSAKSDAEGASTPDTGGFQLTIKVVANEPTKEIHTIEGEVLGDGDFPARETTGGHIE